MHNNHYHHRRANQIKRGSVVTRRPGLITAVIMPIQLRNQNARGADANPVKLSLNQVGKTLTGGVQWRFKQLRPGLARPLLVASQATDKAEKEAARDEGNSEAAPVMIPKALAKGAPKGPLSGWWR